METNARFSHTTKTVKPRRLPEISESAARLYNITKCILYYYRLVYCNDYCHDLRVPEVIRVEYPKELTLNFGQRFMLFQVFISSKFVLRHL